MGSSLLILTDVESERTHHSKSAEKDHGHAFSAFQPKTDHLEGAEGFLNVRLLDVLSFIFFK